MNICVHTRPRLLLTASVSRLERRSQGLSMKRHLLMGKLQNRIYSLQTSNSTAPHSTPIYMAPSSPCLNCSAPHDTTDLVAAIEEQPAALCGGWLISLSSPFSPKEKKKKSTPRRLSSSSITAGETQEKVALSFPCVTTRALSNYSP